VIRVSKGHYYKYGGLLGVELVKYFMQYIWEASAKIKIPADAPLNYQRNPLFVPPSDLISISAQNFTKEILGKNKDVTWLLEFNSIWSSLDSQIYAPMVELMASLYNSNYSNLVRIARVDCSLPINRILCRNFPLETLPTYIMIKEDKYRIYAGDLSMTGLIHYIRKGHKDHQAYPVPLRSRNDGIDELFGIIDDFLHKPQTWIYIKWLILASYCVGMLVMLLFALVFCWCCRRKRTIKDKNKDKDKDKKKKKKKTSRTKQD